MGGVNGEGKAEFGGRVREKPKHGTYGDKARIREQLGTTKKQPHHPCFWIIDF